MQLKQFFFKKKKMSGDDYKTNCGAKTHTAAIFENCIFITNINFGRETQSTV